MSGQEYIEKCDIIIDYFEERHYIKFDLSTVRGIKEWIENFEDYEESEE